MDKTKLGKISLIISVSLAILFITYFPHYNYSFPLHIDEWHHITEAMKLGLGGYTGGSSGFEVGFHFFLFILSKIMNLINFYQFLPAIWATLSGLTLFYVVYKKTRNFQIAIFSMIFFAFIKSNINLGGLWFFTPLTFSLPFIFLYIYFFSEGLEKENKKFILMSLAIMVFLLPIHSISVLFAIPFLFFYSLWNYSYLLKEWKFFSLFLIIPALGIIIYCFFINSAGASSFSSLLNDLVFPRGWGVVELDNLLLEAYSNLGAILALIGIIYLLYKKEKLESDLLYVLWPIWIFVMIVIYRIFDVSYLSPFQRNMYYFTISLPFLSAIGLNFIIESINKQINKIKINLVKKEYLQKTILAIILILIFASLSIDYYETNKNIPIYHIVQNNDLEALSFLSNQSQGKVMADFSIASAVYPLSRQNPVAAISFYGDKYIVRDFFANTTNCTQKQAILIKNQAKYILTKSKLNCNWTLIYNQNNYIYSTGK